MMDNKNDSSDEKALNLHLYFSAVPNVALFVTWFENYEIRVRRLSEEEVGDVLNYGMDIFLNLKHFLPA